MGKSKAKIIVAREGLIIIGLLLLGGFSFYLHLLQSKNLEFTENLEFIIIAPVLKSKEENNILIDQGIILSFPESTKDAVIKETINRDFPKIQFDSWVVLDDPLGQEIKSVNAFYDQKGNRLLDYKYESIFYKINFSYITIFFLFVCYPIYLILRFIVWAIVTLRTQGKTA